MENKADQSQLPTIYIQPMDGDWSMGEEYPLQVSIDITVVALMKLIEKMKGIPAYRQQVKLSGGKLVPKSREIWALRRHGIQNNSRIKVEPTRPGAWLWNDIEYYVNKLLGEVVDILAIRDGPMLLTELSSLIKYPPCFNYSLRVFLRKYPDQIRLRTDVSSDKIWVSLAQGIQLPTFENAPINLGRVPEYDVDRLDWEDYSDVDSVKPIESSVTLPDVFYDIAVFSGKALASNGDILVTNPFVVVLLDGKYIGHSTVRPASRSPEWDSARFRVGLPFGCNMGDYTLSFEVWNVERAPIPKGGMLLEKKVILQRLQYVDISRSRLADFLQPYGVDIFHDFALTSVAHEARQAELRRQELEQATTEQNENGEEQGETEDEVEREADDSQPAAKKSEDEEEEEEEELAYSFLNKKEEKPVEIPVCSPEELLQTSMHGSLRLMGCRSIYQLKVRAAFELYSHETELSEEMQPFIIVHWNGVDIGQTDFRKNTRWASWDNAIYNIPVPGNMEPGQCTLKLEVWNMGVMGGNKTLMSSVTLNGRLLREFLTKKKPFATRQQFDLNLRPLQGESKEDNKPNKKKDKGKKNNKASHSGGGYVSLLGGPVGLQEKDLRMYEVKFLVGSSLARDEVYCILYWNSVEVGRTNSAPSTTEKLNSKMNTVKWYWKRNKFVFGIPANEVIKNCELKIDCYDPTTKGVNSYLGMASLAGEELEAFLCQEFAMQQQVTLKKDPKKDDKLRIQKGTLSIRGGSLGCRMESERIIDIRGCTGLSMLTSGETPPVPCYCIAYWDANCIGKTRSVGNDGNPSWEWRDDRWIFAVDVVGSAMYYSNSNLVIEVWEGESEDEDRSTHVFIGSCVLTGNPLHDVLENLKPNTIQVPLSSVTWESTQISKKNKRKTKSKKGEADVPPNPRVQGYMTVGSPGVKDKTPLEEYGRVEETLTHMLNNEVERSGPQLFERVVGG